jgi:hypothetical protein
LGAPALRGFNPASLLSSPDEPLTQPLSRLVGLPGVSGSGGSRPDCREEEDTEHQGASPAIGLGAFFLKCVRKKSSG